VTNTFIDEYLPAEAQGLPCMSAPRFSTRITLAKSGDEARNQNWYSPLRRFSLPEAVGDQDTFEQVLTFWLNTGGPFATWPFRDPFEFASCALSEANVEPDYTAGDQLLGVGNGTTTQWQLTKVRPLGGASSGYSYTRTISLPILSTIEIEIDGYAPADCPEEQGGPYTVVSITRPGGLVTITPPIKAGVAATWGGLFDTEVRFEGDDSFDQVMHSFSTTGSAPLNFVEVRRC
jgi:uncharacterized protein (TIGR02217 family)